MVGSVAREVSLSNLSEWPTIGAMLRRDEGRTRDALADFVTEVDALCDAKSTGEQCGMMAEAILTNFRHLSAGSLIMAIRDGLSRGKVFGKLTYPVIAEWIQQHMEQLEEHNYRQHRSNSINARR